LSLLFSPLSNANYRRYAAGGTVSNIGTWMQGVDQDWLVLQLSGNSGEAIGITTRLQFLPFLLCSPFTGPPIVRLRVGRPSRPIFGFAVITPLLGITAMTMIISTNAFLQLSTAAEMRGRVLALYMMIFIGGAPLGLH
jgi:hypothetical protein